MLRKRPNLPTKTPKQGKLKPKSRKPLETTFMMDIYRKGWALRYLREAKAELEAARKIPYMAPSLVLEAIRKARNAIYYSLGEPAFIEVLIRDEAISTQPTNETILRFLVTIEGAVQQLAPLEEMKGDFG